MYTQIRMKFTLWPVAQTTNRDHHSTQLSSLHPVIINCLPSVFFFIGGIQNPVICRKSKKKIPWKLQYYTRLRAPSSRVAWRHSICGRLNYATDNGSKYVLKTCSEVLRSLNFIRKQNLYNLCLNVTKFLYAF